MKGYAGIGNLLHLRSLKGRRRKQKERDERKDMTLGHWATPPLDQLLNDVNLTIFILIQKKGHADRTTPPISSFSSPWAVSSVSTRGRIFGSIVSMVLVCGFFDGRIFSSRWLLGGGLGSQNVHEVLFRGLKWASMSSWSVALCEILYTFPKVSGHTVPLVWSQEALQLFTLWKLSSSSRHGTRRHLRVHRPYCQRIWKTSEIMIWNMTCQMTNECMILQHGSAAYVCLLRWRTIAKIFTWIESFKWAPQLIVTIDKLKSPMHKVSATIQVTSDNLKIQILFKFVYQHLVNLLPSKNFSVHKKIVSICWGFLWGVSAQV